MKLLVRNFIVTSLRSLLNNLLKRTKLKFKKAISSDIIRTRKNCTEEQPLYF